MSHADAMIGIAMGSAALVLGVKATDFYALGPGQRPKPTTKTVPRWLGRMWFIAIGVFLICWSLPSLRGDWHWRELLADWWLLAFFGVVCVLNLMFSESESEVEIQSLQLGPKQNDS